MARIKIDKNRCKGCMLCVSFCPRGLIVGSKRLNRRGIHYVEFGKKKDATCQDGGRMKLSSVKSECTGCAMCAVICPDVCIEVYK